MDNINEKITYQKCEDKDKQIKMKNIIKNKNVYFDKFIFFLYFLKTIHLY